MRNDLLHSFANNPINLDIQRSKFNRPNTLKTSFNNGMLIPIYVDEVLPGDTFSVTTKIAMRLSTLIKPIMDDIYCDVYYFYVPNRIVWENFEEFMGENKDGYWTVGQKSFEVPHVSTPNNGARRKSLSDYLGLPVATKNGNDGKFFHFNDLYRRAYYTIWNEWFRDQNLQAPVYVPKSSGDTVIKSSVIDNYNPAIGPIETAYENDMIMPVCKLHDYFTSALPQPQKGPDVPLIALDNATVPVFSSPELHQYNVFPVHMATDLSQYDNSPNFNFNGQARGTLQVHEKQSFNDVEGTMECLFDGDTASNGYPIAIDNLWANLQGSSALTINDLRLAFALQRYYEKAARGGTRYREIIKSFFGVTSPDSRMQIPEYLGGTRFRVNINQVVQTSASDVESPQGNMAGYSLTNEYNESFTKSFVEHGMIIGVLCTRHKHMYQQGVNRMFLRRDLFDYYNPTFANIGEQPIRRAEIYADGLTADITDFDSDSNGIFGYQEAWAEYRYKPSIVTAEMRSGGSNSLDIWHLADNYTSRPYLNDKWIRETPSNLDRVLAVTSSISDQFQLDVTFDSVVVRPMPLYSIPGLIDHN